MDNERTNAYTEGAFTDYEPDNIGYKRIRTNRA